jgi:hypothetical protein
VGAAPVANVSDDVGFVTGAFAAFDTAIGSDQ